MIKISGAYNSTMDFYVCVQTFSSVQSSTAFQHFPHESTWIRAETPWLTAQLFADAHNGKTRNSTDLFIQSMLALYMLLFINLKFYIWYILFTHVNYQLPVTPSNLNIIEIRIVMDFK